MRFIGVCTSTKHLCIVTELCDNGDLYDYMRKAKQPTLSQQVSDAFWSRRGLPWPG